MTNTQKHTSWRYLILAAVFILLGLGLVFLPDRQNTKEMQPEHMLSKLVDESRFMTTDQVADKIINNDPSLILVDVRNATEYEKWTLPGALNIPVEEILSEDAIKILSSKAYDKVLFANNDLLAEQCWILINRMLLDRTYVMKGGLNTWVETIINPSQPTEAAPTEDFEVYNFRLGASRYFAGRNDAFKYVEGNDTVSPKTAQKKKVQAKVVVPPPVEEAEEDEGC
jgi:rhodanese-related sulfurtransferase